MHIRDTGVAYTAWAVSDTIADPCAWRCSAPEEPHEHHDTTTHRLWTAPATSKQGSSNQSRSLEHAYFQRCIVASCVGLSRARHYHYTIELYIVLMNVKVVPIEPYPPPARRPCEQSMNASEQRHDCSA